MLYFHPIGKACPRNAENAEAIRARESQESERCQEIALKRPERSYRRLQQQKKISAQARLEALVDPQAKTWYLNEWMGYFEQPQAPRAAVICVLAQVCQRQVIVIANDNTVSAGSWYQGSPKKIQNAQNLALKLGLPVLYLIESAGLYLPQHSQIYGAKDGAGAIFKMQVKLNRAGNIQLAAVFGDCIAGGGYLPLLCDRILMTETASICIGGRALYAQSKQGQAQQLGNCDVHCHQSGCADERLPNDESALRRLRELIQALPVGLSAFYRLAESLPPRFDGRELYELLPIDPSQSYAIEDLLARLVDASQIHPLAEEKGEEIFAALALVDGLPLLFLANRRQNTQNAEGKLRAGGLLYQEGIDKMAQLSSKAADDGIPVVWLQDVSGFDIGPEAEREGLLRRGARLFHAILDKPNAVASLCLILRQASGAGYYAMKGSPFEPTLIAATNIAELVVMKAETLANTVYEAKIKRLAPEAEIDRANLLAAKELLQAQSLGASRIEAANARGDVDLLVALSDLRQLLVDFARAAYASPRARRAPRLWSILNEG